MRSGSVILGVDVGTHAVRTIVLDADATVLHRAERPLVLRTPGDNRIEMDPLLIVAATVDTIREAVSVAVAAGRSVIGLGLASMRETAVVWDRASGLPVHDAILWMSHQSADYTDRWLEQGLGPEVVRRTGALLQPRFSASKFAWILDRVDGARDRASRGELAAGTVDAWLLSRLTVESAHLTDCSNAASTMLFDIHSLCWDDYLCDRFGIAPELLPSVMPSDSRFGTTRRELFGIEIPILTVLGDQQAGLFGQTCLDKGMAKYTFGTAGVLTLNSGSSPRAHHGFTTSVAWQINEEVSYEIEGAVPHSGYAMQWLHERMRLLPGLADADVCSHDGSNGVYFVPAFTGFGAPTWDLDARGAILGLGVDTRPEHIASAALESMAFQARDSIDALQDLGEAISAPLKVDGGAARYDVMCQFLADVLDRDVVRPRTIEMTAVGAARLAGLTARLWDATDEVIGPWHAGRTFTPSMSRSERELRYAGWLDACAGVRGMQPRESGSQPNRVCQLR